MDNEERCKAYSEYNQKDFRKKSINLIYYIIFR